MKVGEVLVIGHKRKLCAQQHSQPEEYWEWVPAR